jgi:hypothetical protein
MKRVAMAVVLLVTTAFAFPTSAPCPIDGQTAYYTGHYQEVQNGRPGVSRLCEFAHPVNINDENAGRHVFWQDCTGE